MNPEAEAWDRLVAYPAPHDHNTADAMVDVHDRPLQLLMRSVREDSDNVRVRVRDAGVGIGAVSMNELAEAFYTTKSNGMCIGLAVSRSMIERHRGRLWAEPNDGPGATFSASLQRSRQRYGRGMMTRRP